MLLLAIGTLATFSIATIPLDAQAADAKPATRVCYRGRPKPDCELFFLTDLTLLRRVYRPSATAEFPGLFDSTTRTVSYRPSAALLSLELGTMKNLGARHAAGLSMILEVDRDAPDIGVKGRYRLWNADKSAWDFGAGVVSREALTLELPLLNGYSRGARDRRLYFTADAAYNIRDYAGVVSRFDVGTFGNRVQPNVSVGVRLSSRPGAIATGAVAVTYATLVALFAIAISTGGDW